MASKRDYYEILGVARGASADEIKRAYRRLARKHHPDVNQQDTEAEARFKEINEAYEVLSDPQKKSAYDQFGHAGLNGQGGYGVDMNFGGLGDIFDMFFGSGFGGAATREHAGPQRGADLRYDLTLTLEEAATGVEKEIRINRFEVCDTCGGSGARPGTSSDVCSVCHGSGQLRQAVSGLFGQTVRIATCPRCRGEGRVITNPCEDCGGEGRRRRAVRKMVDVPAGVDTGMRMRLSGEGDVGMKGGPHGDLYIVTHVQEHPIFQRDGNDIYCRVTVTMVQAALGASVEVPVLGGKERLNLSEATQNGQAYTLRGRGIPDPNGRGKGDQHVIVEVETPDRLNDEQKRLLVQFAELRGEKLEVEEDKGFFERVKDALGGL